MSGDGRRLANMIMGAANSPSSKDTDIVVGTVISTSPLKIRMGKLDLTSAFLILSPFCYPKSISAESIPLSGHSHSVELSTDTDNSTVQVTLEDHTHTVDGETTSANHSGVSVDITGHSHTASGSTSSNSSSVSSDILLWRGLQVGDNVLMLKCGRGQTYYVLQREGGVTT